MKTLLAIDIGTTAVKAALFDNELNQLAIASREYTLISGGEGILELNPDTYWNGIKDTLCDLVSQAGISPEDIMSVTIDTQGETFIPVDENGAALHNAVIWLDSRAGKEAEAIKGKFSEEYFYSYTGLPEINGYLPISKLKWFKETLPEVYSRTYKFMLLEDYIIMRLSGRFVTNPSIQSSTGYYNVRENKYWDEMLSFCGIPCDKLPEVLPCATVVGKVCGAACRELGLSPDASVTTGAQDQVAAAIGCGNIRKGIVTDTIGTCQVIAGTDDAPRFDEYSQLSIYMHAIPGLYYVLMVNQTAGIVQKWFKTEFCKDLSEKYGDGEIYSKMGELAAEEPPLSRGLTLFPYFTGMQGRVSNPNVRGCFVGAGLETGRGCFIRAIMEGISYMSRETLEFMNLNPDELIALGGGAKSPIWNQIKADVFNKTIKTVSADEAALLGTAILGAVATGLYPGIEEASQKISVAHTYTPNAENVKEYEKGYRRFLEISKAMISLFK